MAKGRGKTTKNSHVRAATASNQLCLKGNKDRILQGHQWTDDFQDWAEAKIRPFVADLLTKCRIAVEEDGRSIVTALDVRRALAK